MVPSIGASSSSTYKKKFQTPPYPNVPYPRWLNYLLRNQQLNRINPVVVLLPDPA